MIQTLSLLGSTGSIGTQALDIIRRLGIQVKALAAYRNIERLEQQIREFQPEFAAVYDVALAKELKLGWRTALPGLARVWTACWKRRFCRVLK